MTSFRNCERGNSLVETLATLGFATTVVTAGCTLAYASFAHVWLEHVAYETCVCLASNSTDVTCRRVLHESVDRNLPFGEVRNVTTRSSSDDVETKIEWRLSESLHFTVVDRRTLPLIPSESPWSNTKTVSALSL